MKITFLLRKNQQAERPLYLVLRHKQKQAMIATGLSLRASQWNASGQSARKSAPGSAAINKHLLDLETKAQEAARSLIAEGLEPWPQDIKARLIKPVVAEEEPCFLAFCETLLGTWEGRWAYQTFLAYQTAVRKLRQFHKRRRLPFSKVTPAMLRRFQQHLARDLGNKANTRHKNLSTLKEFFHQAMEDGVIEWQRNPFDSLTLSKEKAVKEKLTTEELKQIAALDLEEGSLLADVRRWFMFAFYAGGMRFSDVALLERKHLAAGDDGSVRSLYRMGKTKGVHGVLLVEEALAILEYYNWRKKKRGERVFPILDGYDLADPKKRREAISSRNVLANKYLRKMAKRAGVDKRVSFHLSRHSLAGYLLEQGYDVYVIKEVLGHATVRITEDYLRGFKGAGPDEAMLRIRL